MNRTAAEKAARELISEEWVNAIGPFAEKAVADIIERSCGQDDAVEASEKLRKQIYDFWHKDRQGFGQASSQAIIRNWIEKALAERACGETAWVSVETELPKVGSTVLVWKEYREYDLVKYSKKSEDHRLYMRQDGQWWDSGDRIIKWTALPSPSPPTERTEEK